MLPAGTSAGHRLLCFIDQDTDGQTITAATGWDATPIASFDNTGPDTQSGRVFEKKNATGSDAVNFTSSSTKRAIVQIVAFSGRDNTAAAVVSTPTVDNSSASSPISIALTGLTAATGDDIAWFAHLDKSAADPWTFSAPASYTERQDSDNGDYLTATTATRDNVSSGATGTVTGTATRSSGSTGAGWSGVMVALPVAAAPTTTEVTGSSTAAVGIAETYTFKLNASPAGTVTITPTAPVAGSWSPTTVGLTSGNWNTGLTSNFTASAAGSGNISSTNDGGLSNDTLAITVYSTSRPSAVTAGSWTDEAGGSLVVADINDASDSTGAKDPAGASYPVLAFTMDTPMAASVAQTCYFRGNDVVAGKQVRQVLFATDGTTVVATGAWHTTTGSLATYSDVLTPTATAYKGEIQTQANPNLTGLLFPTNASSVNPGLMWTGAGKLPMVPATYIHRVTHSNQAGYYTTFFNGRGDGTFAGSNDYYGCHPYPDSGDASGTTHKFEVSARGADYVTDLNANPTAVSYDVEYIQAVCVYNSGGKTIVDFYWDLPDTTKLIRYDAGAGNILAEDGAHTPTLIYGIAPWSYAEQLNGILRGIQQYDYDMSAAGTTTTDLLLEAANHTSDTPVTSGGVANVWYMNQNPTPTDVTDKSGAGHDPTWLNTDRPTLWTS